MPTGGGLTEIFNRPDWIFRYFAIIFDYTYLWSLVRYSNAICT